MRILVVEDTQSVRLLIATLLRKWGHEVLEADDGREAWRILNDDPVRFVVSDWMMPHMDGPQLCRRIRDADLGGYVYFILLTSRDDKSDLVEGMRSGADDFVTKPFAHDELEVRIKAGIRILDLESSLARQNAELSRALGIIRRDLEAAARTQSSLLPENAFEYDGARFDWLYRPSAYIGGDSLGYFALDAEHVAFFSIDVSGHGVPAALVSVTLNRFISPGLCRTAADAIAEPHEVVARLNREFGNQHDESFYFTMLFGLHNTRTGRTKMCQAGHPHPMLLSSSGEVTELGEGGMPVALLPDARYESFAADMRPGDRLVLYSDGVPECRSRDGEPFGADRLRRRLVQHHSLPGRELLARLEHDLEQWRGADTFEDDLSMVCLGHRGTPA